MHLREFQIFIYKDIVKFYPVVSIISFAMSAIVKFKICLWFSWKIYQIWLFP